MRKTIIIFLILIPSLMMGQIWKQYFEVPNKSVRFRQVLPKGTLVFEKDSCTATSLGFYKLDTIFKETDSMTTVFRSGKYTRPGGTIHDLFIQGDIEVMDSLSGLILRSPANIRYRIKVADDGTITATEL